MNLEEKLQQAKFQFPSHTVDKEKFMESLLKKVDRLENIPRVQPRRHRLIISTAAIMLIGGLAISPVIATAAQKIPLVHVVLNWVNGTDAAPYVRNVQQSSTDRGITMTITDVLYGPSQLSFGFIVTPGQPGFPHGGVVGLGAPNGMEFFVNGKPVQLQAIGEDGPTAYGFKGLVTLTNAGTSTSLPKRFNLQIVLHKIGHQRGTWKFNVPVSRTDMAPRHLFLPMVTKQIGNEMITVKEVRFYPTGGVIDYDVTAPVGVKPSLTMVLYSQNKNLLDSVVADGATAQSHATRGDTETWSYAQSFRVPGQTPTSLMISALAPSKSHSESVPIVGHYPITVYSGVFGRLTLTRADVNGNTVTVYYTSQGKPSEPGLSFSIEDTNNPNVHFEGTIGEHVGRPGSDAYKNVYHFANNVNASNLILRLPQQQQNNVFKVPLSRNQN